MIWVSPCFYVRADLVFYDATWQQCGREVRPVRVNPYVWADLVFI